MSFPKAYATADEFAQFWCIPLPLSLDEEAMITAILQIAASDIHAALASAGAADCQLASWAGGYLKKLNIIDAAVIHNCPCGAARLSDDMKRTWIMWLTDQLNAIRAGQIVVCAGDTGRDYPALGWAEIGWTDYQLARIALNRFFRNT